LEGNVVQEVYPISSTGSFKVKYKASLKKTLVGKKKNGRIKVTRVKFHESEPCDITGEENGGKSSYSPKEGRPI